VGVHELGHSCALDVADDGEHTLHEVGEMLNLTRERTRQIEERAIAKLQKQHAKEIAR
jgi:DNA-directed RNA polymerase sigma subunit (sigma70/sigma32)